MAKREPEPEPLPEDARLTSLDERLRRARLEEDARTAGKRKQPRPGQKQGMRILSDLIGIPFGSALIGWTIDRWAGTMPWTMLALMFLGFGAAVWNVLRISKQPPES